MKTLIFTGGFLSFALAAFHSSFYYYFNWKDDLKNISVMNAKIFMTLHIGIIALFIFFGFLSFAYTEELSRCNGFHGIVTGFYAFLWLFRTIWQVTYLKDFKSERPLLHYILMVCFLILTASYSIPIIAKLHLSGYFSLVSGIF